MLQFDIIRDFRLSVKPKYKDLDAYIEEINRKGKFNAKLAETEIVNYLKDDANITLSWAILLLTICILSSIIIFVFGSSLIIKIISLITLSTSIIVFIRFKNKIKNFNFKKSMLMSFMNMSNYIDSKY